MKIAFISDIHANLEAFESVLKDIEKKEINEIYCLGDIVGYGPNPNEVIEIIKNKNIKCVRGNYDDAIGFEKESCGCAYNPGRETEVGDESINWTIKNTSKENKKFLRELPLYMEFEKENLRFFLTHGSPFDNLFEYIKPSDNAEKFIKISRYNNSEIFVFGHTHLMMAKHINGKVILNPGSVGRTKDGEPLATYLIMDIFNGIYFYEFIKVKYNVKTTIEKIVNVGLPVELAVVLALGKTYNMGKAKINSRIGFRL
ncbi:phosphoesterase, MJ0936 family [Marinitoga piezophila KA3]|uniref:Phosphoesterase n=1 Tax=Marinitoga piezophila (strain DSM 14283 / JCM 11233 / KA3) TaxID=443254 RepID=H2J5M4_MARPK|nr:YfcE family phosphodiesterase [Marinitoga piezophila]AEX85010.1 phosphoesterase, MJ0936 family [Marinitoga piezophila KA3]